MSIGHFFAYLSAISLLASTKKGTEKKIVKKDHVLLKRFPLYFQFFSYYRFDEKKKQVFLPPLEDFNSLTKYLFRFCGIKKENNENSRFKRSIFYCPHKGHFMILQRRCIPQF